MVSWLSAQLARNKLTVICAKQMRLPMIAKIVVVPLVLAPCLLITAKGRAQDVPGIEICTVEKTMERRTSCLQSNIDFLQKTITKLAADHQQKLDAANRQIESLKATTAGLQKAMDELQAAQKKAGGVPKKTDAPPVKDTCRLGRATGSNLAPSFKKKQLESDLSSSLRGAKRRSNPVFFVALDCFAEPVIGRRFAPPWLAMTICISGRWFRNKKDVDGRVKPGHDHFNKSPQLLFSPDMSGPNNSQLSPLKRIICNCSSGAKSVGLVLILVPGR